MMIQPISAVSGGTEAMISMEMRDPMLIKALNNRKSPSTKPTSPEMESQNQACAEASNGSAAPRNTYKPTVRKTNPMHSRMTLTDRDPTLFPAASKASAVTVQKKAVARAANSPK